MALTASQSNKRERLADAMRIEWNDFTDTYSTELWLHLTHELATYSGSGPFIPTRPIWFGGKEHMMNQTQIEDLLKEVTRSHREQQSIRAGH